MICHDLEINSMHRLLFVGTSECRSHKECQVEDNSKEDEDGLD